MVDPLQMASKWIADECVTDYEKLVTVTAAKSITRLRFIESGL